MPFKVRQEMSGKHLGWCLGFMILTSNFKSAIFGRPDIIVTPPIRLKLDLHETRLKRFYDREPAKKQT